LNLSCSKFLAPKFYLDLIPYSQNTVHRLCSPHFSTDFLAILIRRECRKSYSSYFGKNLNKLHTRRILFKRTGKRLLLHGCNTQDGGWNQSEVLRDGTATYCLATVYHGHLITPTNNHTDILY
jgi:hypothetical protein